MNWNLKDSSPIFFLQPANSHSISSTQTFVLKTSTIELGLEYYVHINARYEQIV
jgi:hypothetical protein